MKGWSIVEILSGLVILILILLLLLFRAQLAEFIEAVTNNMILETGGRL